MSHIIYSGSSDNPGDALARSHAEALARNCVPPSIYWWAVFRHPTDGRAAMIVDDNDLSGLTQAEQDARIPGDPPEDWLDDYGNYINAAPYAP